MAGKRHSSDDQARLNSIVQSAIDLGADHPRLMAEVVRGEWEPKSADETLITFGTEVKALDGGRVGGYLVRFSTATDPDLSGDFFTAATDFGEIDSSPVLYHHGLDANLKRRSIGKGKLKKDEVGVWIDAQLELRDDYEKAIYELAQAGKLGWSSGTAPHLVERAPEGKAARIVAWPLGLDASMTPIPAEPRNAAMTLKAYVDLLGSAPADTPAPARADTPAPEAKSAPITQPIESHLEEHPMTTETQADGNAELLAALTKLTAEVSALKAAAPVERTPGVAGIIAEQKAPVQIAPALQMADEQLYEMKKYLNDHGEIKAARERWERHTDKVRAADAEHVKAYNAWVRNPRDPYRAQAMQEAQMKATLLEGTASLGGNLVPTLYSNELVGTLKENSILRMAGAYQFPVTGTNSLKLTTITRSASAVLTAENAAPTAQEPTFGLVSFDAYAYKATYVASREVLVDSRFDLNGVLMENFGWQFIQSENNQFAIGTGSSQPQGIAVGANMAVSGGSTLALATANGDKILDLYHALPYQYRPNAVWFANDAVIKAIRQSKWAVTTGAASTTTYNQYLWQEANAMTAGAPFGSLMGRPIYPLNTMASSGSSGAVLVFADPRFFWISDFSTGGTEIQVLNETYAASFAVGWNAWRRFDSNLVVSEAAQSMKLL